MAHRGTQKEYYQKLGIIISEAVRRALNESTTSGYVSGSYDLYDLMEQFSDKPGVEELYYKLGDEGIDEFKFRAPAEITSATYYEPEAFDIDEDSLEFTSVSPEDAFKSDLISDEVYNDLVSAANDMAVQELYTCNADFEDDDYDSYDDY